MQNYYVTSAKKAYQVKKTALLLRISTWHIVISDVNSQTSLSYYKGVTKRTVLVTDLRKEGRKEIKRNAL